MDSRAREGTDGALTHPAWITALLVAAACVTLSASFELYEKDFWQHLAVGRAIWETGSVPTTQIWTWPTYGSPDVNSSWGFRVLIWPVWNLAGVWGLFVWRWAAILLVFGIAWAIARRLGARGMSPLFVMALCALTYRQRAHIRPEMLAAVLLALQIWVLERWRQRVVSGPRAHAASARTTMDGHARPAANRTALGHGLAVAVIAWAWVNCHLSSFLGFGLIAAHLIDAHIVAARGRPGFAGHTRHLWLAAGAALVISLVNPFGWRALWQPFEFVLVQRHEPIFSSIPELQPLDLRYNVRNLLPLVLFGWPLLAIWRAISTPGSAPGHGPPACRRSGGGRH